MPSLSSVPLSRKLPVIIGGISLAAAVTVAGLSYLDFRDSMVKEAQHHFDVLAEERGIALENWVAEVENNVLAYARMPSVINATQALSSSFALLDDSTDLQAAYITNNPNPVGQKGLLDQAPEAIPYNFQHGAFHPFFRNLVNDSDYRDVFLLNTAGDVVYSYAKEVDFAANVLSGSLQDSGLGQAFIAARDGVAEAVYFADFERYAPSGSAAAAFLATQVSNGEGAVVGVYAVQLETAPLEAIVNRPVGLGETGEMYIAGPDGMTRSASRFAGGHLALQNVSTLQQVTSGLAGARSFFTDVTGINGQSVLAEVSQIEVFGARWRVIGEMDMAEVLVPVTAMRNKMIGTTALVMGLAALLGYLTARSVIRPLERLGDGMGKVAQRDYDFMVADTDRGDELGVLAKALVDFRDKLKGFDAAEDARKKVQAEQARVVEALSKGMVALAEGDLTAVIHTPFDESYEQLRIDYNRTVSHLSATVGSVVTSAAGIRDRALEMSSASDDLSRRTENQAATLEQTAAALDELTASVRSAADGAREVETIVADARNDANASEPVVQKAVAAMTAIEKSSDEITQIVGVIDDIAFQTNLLALNAGVEAARAGDAGRGFAVVASEVRALAQRSSEAAKQIKTLIAGSSDQVASGVSLVGEAGEVLMRIAKHISHISGLISEIAAGAAEQSTGLAEINIGVTQLDKVTQQNAAMVDQATASSHALNAEAGNLSDLVARFHLDQTDVVQTGASRRSAENVMVFQSPRSQQKKPPPAPIPTTPVAMTGTYGRSAATSSDGWQDF
ncbi:MULTISPECIES: methyl-accepting chemotaxis protein [unclassified Yoonia]|uniref:methyl-accepting chemotaxis protein n=1 Tax=unclassified Yoonia TaxID=2629118 RepID=UPI002AFDCE3A|nr:MULTISPECIES: methyl-accepting chemotaxis protein [unclassified Yoonia]